jgi:hypothetical protein
VRLKISLREIRSQRPRRAWNARFRRVVVRAARTQNTRLVNCAPRRFNLTFLKFQIKRRAKLALRGVFCLKAVMQLLYGFHLKYFDNFKEGIINIVSN